MRAGLGAAALAVALLLASPTVAHATTPNGHILPDDQNKLSVCKPGKKPSACPAIDNSPKSLRTVVAYPVLWAGKVEGLGVRVPKGHTTDALYYESPVDPMYVYWFEYQALRIPSMNRRERVKLYYKHPKRGWITRCKPKGDKLVKLPWAPYEVNPYHDITVRVVTKCRNRG